MDAVWDALDDADVVEPGDWNPVHLPDERPLLTVTEVATRLHLSRSAAYNLIANHALPAVRIGRSVRVRPGTLERWIAEQELAS